MLPTPLLEQMANRIVRMQSLHHQTMIEPSDLWSSRDNKCARVPLFLRLTRAFRLCILRLERIVDNDQVAAATGQGATDRGGEARSHRRWLRFQFRCPLRD